MMLYACMMWPFQNFSFYVPISATITGICLRWPNNIEKLSQKIPKIVNFPLGKNRKSPAYHHGDAIDPQESDSPPQNTKVQTRCDAHRHPRISLRGTCGWNLSIWETIPIRLAETENGHVQESRVPKQSRNNQEILWISWSTSAGVLTSLPQPCWSSGSMKPNPLCENQRIPRGVASSGGRDGSC